jgi:replicative DNA helicase
MMNSDLTTESGTERLPPQSLDAEQAVLGALMVSGDGITRIVDLLQPESFYRKAHQVIYSAMVDLYEKNEPIDIVTLSQYLKDEGRLDNVGGRQYITDLSLSVATTANLEYYAKTVQEKALLRHLIKAGTEIVGSCYEETDAEIALDKAEHLIFGLAQKRNMQQLVHIKHVVEDSFASIEKRYENRDTLSGVPTGFYDLDALTSGFQKSDLVIIAARPSMGKCLAFDSEIALADGSLVTIEDIYRNRSASLLTLNDDLRLSITSPETFVDDGLKPVFKVTTRLGRTVETTITHPFLTISGWKKLAEIKVGQKIAVPRTIPLFGTQSLRECEIKLLAYLIGDGCLSNGNVSFTNTNPAIQQDFTKAVNTFGGTSCRSFHSRNRAPQFGVRSDQSTIERNRANFGSRLRSMLIQPGSAENLASKLEISPGSIVAWKRGTSFPRKELFQRLCEALDLLPRDLAPDGHTASSRRSKNPITEWLIELGLFGKTAHTKTIPAVIFKLNRENLKLFLNRLFSTDGWATKLTSGQCQIGYATVSEKLARQIQHLLLRFGIIAKLRTRSVKSSSLLHRLSSDKYKETRRTCFQLDITHSESIHSFVNEIGIFGKELAVQSVLSAIETKRKQTNTDLIPIEIWSAIQSARGNESWASLARRSNFVGTSNIHANRRAPSRTRLFSLANSLQDIQLTRLATSEVYWDEIVSIEAMGIKQVYDLTIPNTHNFVANDICVHNTAFVLNLAQSAAVENNVPVAIFSLEMSKEQLVQRMLCSEAHIDANRLRTGHMHTNDWTHLATAMGRLGEAPIFIDDSAMVNALEIRAKCRRLKAEMKGLGLIIIDYIQLMQGRKATDNRVQEVSEISRSLKTLARELSVPVVALSQLSRAVEARQNKRPMLSDLRESGSIEQDADIVMFIYRDEYYNPESDKRGEAEIIIAKQRNGPVGTVDLLYQSSITRFLNKVHNQYAAPA